MGAYLYATKPTHTAVADIQLACGSILTDVEIALYHYCYKPTLWDSDDFNRKMDFKTGVWACRNAWMRAARKGRKFPTYGVNIHLEKDGQGEVELCPSLFVTRDKTDVLDDFVNFDGARVLMWVRLPADVRETASVD